MRTGRPAIPIAGRVFSYLTVLSRNPMNSKRILCECACGAIKEFSYSNVTSGQTHSCGCKKGELISQHSPHATHRMRHSPEWNIWQGMLRRCHSEGDKAFRHYGGRGIFVCDQWRHSFAQFYSDMGPRPKGLTMERKQNDGPYSPDNCMWADWFQQANNRRSSVKITHDGKTLSPAQWALLIGVPVGTIHKRRSAGMPVEKILAGKGTLKRWP